MPDSTHWPMPEPRTGALCSAQVWLAHGILALAVAGIWVLNARMAAQTEMREQTTSAFAQAREDRKAIEQSVARDMALVETLRANHRKEMVDAMKLMNERILARGKVQERTSR